ncbi:MAG: class I SAM-dependent methyltransferase [Candidatus Electrothrix scaldis]|nr:MAG: class I SAM-dependent methyltransferase [Candidatus Electrothrix sp. GW3-3]
MKQITLCCLEPGLVGKAEELAARLELPLTFEMSEESPLSGEKRETDRLVLRLSSEGLDLIKPDDRKLSGVLRVDFTAGHAAFRRKQQKKELLVRAVGGKGGALLNIIDATGGLGRDSFLLAAAGHRVRIFEQQSVVAALLADGLERATAHPDTAEICTRIRLTTGDAVSVLEALQEQKRGEPVDVVYLDPMFPERRKSALVKKELQILQLLAEQDAAPERLLAAALKVATQRVVVKRPLKAPHLTELVPSHSLAGKTVRFDVYLGGLLSRN